MNLKFLLLTLSAIMSFNNADAQMCIRDSLDIDLTKWKNAIAKDKLQYTQLIDPYGFDAKSAVQFGVEALPASYLFDATGILIAINPAETDILKQLNHNKK